MLSVISTLDADKSGSLWAYYALEAYYGAAIAITIDRMVLFVFIYVRL